MNNFGNGNDKLITNTSIKEYFHDTVNEALANQHINASEETAYYLVNLLTAFSRSEHLFEKSEKHEKPHSLYESLTPAQDPSKIKGILSLYHKNKLVEGYEFIFVIQ